MYIHNLQRLKDYKERLLHSQELLDVSPIFSLIEKIEINEVYSFLIQIISNKINQMQVATKNATNLTVSGFIHL